MTLEEQMQQYDDEQYAAEDRAEEAVRPKSECEILAAAMDSSLFEVPVIMNTAAKKKQQKQVLVMPTNDPTPGPTPYMTPGPTPQPTNDPTPGLAPNPTLQPNNDPTTDSTPNPTPQPTEPGQDNSASTPICIIDSLTTTITRRDIPNIIKNTTTVHTTDTVHITDTTNTNNPTSNNYYDNIDHKIL